jgi:hypothetical protein
MNATQPAEPAPIPVAPWRVPRGRRSTPICTPEVFYARVVGLAVGEVPEVPAPRCWLCERRTGLPFAVKPPPISIDPIPFPGSGQVSASICRRCSRSPSIRYYLRGPAIQTNQENEP